MTYTCIACGTALVEELGVQTCLLCGQREESDLRCPQGHYQCEDCRLAEPGEAVERACAAASSQDPVVIADAILVHPHFRDHGPHHHVLVAAVLVPALRNAGFAGLGPERSLVLLATSRALADLARLGGPRCCRIAVYAALDSERTVLGEALGVRLPGGSARCHLPAPSPTATARSARTMADRSVWCLLGDDLREPRRHFAVEEAVLRGVDEGGSPDTLRLRRFEPPVWVCVFQDPAEDVDMDACRALGLPAVRLHNPGGRWSRTRAASVSRSPFARIAPPCPHRTSSMGSWGGRWSRPASTSGVVNLSEAAGRPFDVEEVADTLIGQLADALGFALEHGGLTPEKEASATTLFREKYSRASGTTPGGPVSGRSLPRDRPAAW